ncbi:MAG: LON peptidase substrate-binding domain-containing protein [Pirellulales bacterium]
MSENALAFDPSTFSGRARLFPLPNLVMFPHVLQPLHVFEPRYRALLEDSLADDRLIAMAVLAPGWEKHYEGRPRLRPFACLGRVVTHQQVEGDKYNILLAGLHRVRIVQEMPPDKLFREATVEIVDDYYPVTTAADRPRLQRELLDSFRKFLPNVPEVHKHLEDLLHTEVSLGMLTDLAGYTLQISIDDKEALLGEPDVDRRCRQLLRLIAALPAKVPGPQKGLKWPPDFSTN